jgi:two-component system, cell cycle response regulator DivK
VSRTDGDKALILIVEDNERNLKLVRDLLQVNGYETVEARNAADGLRFARERNPTLILMDIQLPDLDGVATLGRLRADERTASIPVVALTAYAMSGDRQRLLAAGFDGYLEKPIDHRLFPSQVRSLLDGRRQKETA